MAKQIAIYTACIKRLEVRGMTWLLVGDDVDGLHVDIEFVVEISFIIDIDSNCIHLPWIIF